MADRTKTPILDAVRQQRGDSLPYTTAPMIPVPYGVDCLVLLYKQFWQARGFTMDSVGSADEHFQDSRLDERGRAWLRAFATLWDATSEDSHL